MFLFLRIMKEQNLFVNFAADWIFENARKKVFVALFLQPTQIILNVIRRLSCERTKKKSNDSKKVKIDNFLGYAMSRMRM
jgi:phosphatidylglycerophosphatase A